MSNIKENIFNSKEFNGMTSFLGFISIPISFMQTGTVKIGFFILGVSCFVILLMKIFKLTEQFIRDFNTVIDKIDEIKPEGFVCVHNCKEKIENDLIAVKTGTTELLDRVNNNEESLEIICINKSNVIIIAQQKTNKVNKLVFRGKNAKELNVSNNAQQSLEFANEILLKKPEKFEDTEVETFYVMNLKQGYNIGIFQLHNTISGTHDSELMLEVLSENSTLITRKKLA